MDGRKRVPEHIKLVKGTDRADRKNPAAPTPEISTPNAPAGLSPRAAELFGRVTARLEATKCASSTHTEMLALLAVRLEEIEICDALIAKHGRLYEAIGGGGTVLLKANPAVTMRSEAMRHAHSLLAEFGLSLASMGKVSKIEPDKAKSGWASHG